MEPSKIKKILFFVLTIWIGLVISDDYSYDYNAPASGSSSYDYPAEAPSYEYENPASNDNSNSYDYAPSTDYNNDYGDNAEQCKYLSANMAGLATCCDYPMLSISEEAAMASFMKCAGIEDSDAAVCCIVTCCFETSGLVEYLKDDNGVAIEPTGMNVDSFVEAYSVDVKHDEAWTSVLRETVPKCIDQNFKNDGQPNCPTLPESVYAVMDCISNENYAKCPHWNPSDNPKCDYNRQYVEKCMEPGKQF